MYEKASRFNHSCQPSTEYVINEKDGTTTVATTANIRAGDEITLQYTEPLSTYAERTALLRDRYIASCNCALCAATPYQRGKSEELSKEVLRDQKYLRAFRDILFTPDSEISDPGQRRARP